MPEVSQGAMVETPSQDRNRPRHLVRHSGRPKPTSAACVPGLRRSELEVQDGRYVVTERECPAFDIAIAEITPLRPLRGGLFASALLNMRISTTPMEISSPARPREPRSRCGAHLTQIRTSEMQRGEHPAGKRTALRNIEGSAMRKVHKQMRVADS